LVFKRATAADLDFAPPKRPQTPQPPFPYVVEDLTYDNPAAQIKLAGTLTLPRATAPVPAVILVSGSGPQGRIEEGLYAVLADHLTRAGIAVLYVDDRGVGKSTGNFATATIEDFANDVLAGIAYLKTRKEIDAKKLGVIGHSEGGLIAPMCAAKSSEVAFIVMMAGPGVTIEEILYEQAALTARVQGAKEDAIAQNRKTLEKIFAILKTEKDPAAADKKLAELAAAEVAAAPEAQKKALEASLSTNFKMTNSPWFRFMLTFDPRLVLRQVKVPVLALNGELDLQVPPQQNLPEIAKALTASGNKNFKTVTLPKLNHLFQTAQTGAVSEYTKIEETIAPAALTLITEWIANQTGLANKPR
ncbi:alpha/beta hydrolase, partial [candidate division KSB1 bacterium]|nr:alpha/beta hydrolase [candidate division KSB1 bacterium]